MNILDEKTFMVDDILCVTAKVQQDFFGTYFVGYTLFPKKFKNRAELAEHECPIEITWPERWGLPDLLATKMSKGKPLREYGECDEFCYLGADTAHVYNQNTEDEIKDMMTEIVRWVKNES